MTRPTATPEEFARLRAERAIRQQAEAQRLHTMTGIPVATIMSTINPDDCYCDCANGGPCEHVFTGWVEWETSGGAFCGSTVCEKCGTSCMSHDLRYAP